MNNQQINICPICGHKYKHLLTHIQIYAKQMEKEYVQLLTNQYELAKQLYNNIEYNSKTHEQYNLLLTYNEYATIWYKHLNLPKRLIKVIINNSTIHCPYCHKDIASIRFNSHLSAYHWDKYVNQVRLAKELFYDYNFSKMTIQNYPDLLLGAASVYDIWKRTYTESERNERANKCNADHVRKIASGRKLTIKHKEQLSKAQVKFHQQNPNAHSNQYAVSGIRPDIGHFAASTYEANVYRIFQYELKRYNRETANTFPIIFPNGEKHNYIIDVQDIDGLFAEPGTYIEIKGYMDKKSLLRIQCFKEQYPQYQLIVIGKQDNISYNYDINYNDLEKKYMPLIPLWETKKDNINTNPLKWGININKLALPTINCPICGEITGKQLYLHIKHHHDDLYKLLQAYIQQLFYDSNFTQKSYKNYVDKLYNISYNTIRTYWQLVFGKKAVSQRQNILKGKLINET